MVLEQNTENTTQRSFNARGQLAKYAMLNTELELVADSNQIEYRYNDVGLNSKMIFSDGSYITKEYDANGNVIENQKQSADSALISSGRKIFDVWNRVVSVDKKQNGSDTISKMSYEYNDDNMLTKLFYPSITDEISVSYEYDHLQRMKTVTDWKKQVTGYEYTATGKISKTLFANGVVCENDYNDAQQLTKINTTKDNVLISLYHATEINENGYPTEITQLQNSRPLESDSKNELSYNLANQLKQIDDGNEIQYDVNGNPTTLPKVDGNISYNDMNLITQYGDDNYQYDAFGLRTQSTINGTTKNYLISSNDYSAPYLSLLDPLMEPEWMQTSNTPSISTSSPLDQLLQISDENNNVEKRFVYGHGLISEESEAGDYSVYHFNEQGSTIALTNEKGIVTDKYAYSPFGEVLAHEGDNETGFLFNGSVGVYTDANGLSNMRSRSYRADLMRFVQQDFLLGDEKNPMSLNRYAFVGDNPISFIDPLGMERKNAGTSKNKTAIRFFRWIALIAVVAGAAYATYFYARRKLMKRALKKAIVRRRSFRNLSFTTQQLNNAYIMVLRRDVFFAEHEIRMFNFSSKSRMKKFGALMAFVAGISSTIAALIGTYDD